MVIAPTAGIAAHHPAPATNRAIVAAKQATRIPIMIRYRRCREAMSADSDGWASVTRYAR
jgi:hypothetical protein